VELLRHSDHGLLIGLVFLVMIGLARLRVASLWPYLGCAALLWYAVLLSGIHPTVAGVLQTTTL